MFLTIACALWNRPARGGEICGLRLHGSEKHARFVAIREDTKRAITALVPSRMAPEYLGWHLSALDGLSLGLSWMRWMACLCGT